MARCASTHRLGHIWAVALLAGLCMAAPAAAQSAIGGIVKDANGRVVVRALVTVKELTSDRVRQTYSSPIGNYEVAKLPPGVYSVTVESEFHEPFVGQVELVRHVMARLDVALKILRHTERITVHGDAVSPAPLATTDLSVGTTFARDAIESLPLTNGRTVQSVLLLVPALVFTDSVGTLAQFTAAGQRRFANRMTIDGMSADLAVDIGGGVAGAAGVLPAFATSGGTQTIVPLGAIEEISVRTTNASPEFARTPGAQTTIITRAGGDRFTGNGFVGLRPAQLTASDWLSNSGRWPHSESRFRNVGASAGGPIAPRRLYYFATWERQAIDRFVTATSQVPSLAAREVATGMVRSVLDAFPRPNGRELDDDLAEYSGKFPAVSDLWTLSLRLDARVGERHRLFARGNWGESSGDALGAVGIHEPRYTFDYKEGASTRTGTAGVTSAFRAFTHDLRFNISTHRGSLVASLADHGGAHPLDPGLMSSSAPTDTQLALTPFPGGLVLSGRVGASALKQFQVVDTLSFVRGSHEWRIGLDYRRVLSAAAPDPVSYTYRSSGIRQFVHGEIPVVTRQARLPMKARLDNWALFADANYRVSPRLSLNYGLRYSVTPALASASDTQPLLLRFETLPNLDPLPTGSPLWNTSWTNFAPRVAAAYQLNTDRGHETVLRASWSLTFDELSAPGSSVFRRGYPYSWSRSVVSPTFPVTESSQPALLPPPFSAGLFADYYSFAQHLRSPRTYQWQAGLDRTLGDIYRVAVAYVGTSGRNLPYRYTYYPQAPSQGQTVQAHSNAARSDYHGLLAELVKRPSKGIHGRVVYTWSHAIDTDSGESEYPLPPPAVVAPRSNRGSADFDRRHVLQFVASYRLPTSLSSNWLRVACSSWQFDVTGTMHSAAPVNVFTATNVGSGVYQLRPDLVPGASIWLDDSSSPGGRRLNPEAFRDPAEPRQGTLGRNSIRAFPLRQIDLSLSRSKRIGERIEVQFRLDAFNALNIPAFGPPSTIPMTPDFGRPIQSYARAMGVGTLAGGGLTPLQQVGGPRSIQLSGRVAF